MSWVADYTSRIPVAALKAAGVVGVCRYVSRHAWKVIGQAEYDELRAAGLAAVLNFEDEATGWLGGGSAGAADAAFSADAADAVGYPQGWPIPSSADFDMTAAQWNAAGHAYAVMYHDGLLARGYLPGVYGPWDVLGWCRSVGYTWFWQAGMSTAWSGGRNAAPWPGAQLRQRFSTTVGGLSVDHNDILQQDWSGDMALTDNEARALGNIENIAVALVQGHDANSYVTSVGAKPIVLANALQAKLAAIVLGGIDLKALAAALAPLLPQPPTAAEIAKAVLDAEAQRLSNG